MRNVALISGVILLSACGGDSPARPSPLTPTPPGGLPQSVAGSPGTFIASGRVLDFSVPGTPQPVPNLRLLIWGRSSGRLDATQLPDVTTDVNGRYTLTDTGRTAFAETAPSSGYMFLCPAYPVLLGFGTWDLPVVQTSWSGDRLPGTVIPSTSVYGTVTERVGDSVVPVAGATVFFDNGTYDAPATTNAKGFYMVCSFVGTDQYRTITARKNGYQPTTQDIFGGWDFVANFTLARTSS